MSIKYIRTLKTMKGVYVRWAEIIEEFTFVVIHAKVVVEDCISREPRHLPEPTMEDQRLERDYESDPEEPGQDLELLAKQESVLTQRPETLWHMEDEFAATNLSAGHDSFGMLEPSLRRSTRVPVPTLRMSESRQQENMWFQEGGQRMEPQQLMRDNQLLERGNTPPPGTGASEQVVAESAGTIDGTQEKGLGISDPLVQAGKPYEFRPQTLEILKKEEDKADWQDQDADLRTIKSWVKEKKQPVGIEMNFQTSEVQAYRKIITALELRPIEGTNKTVLVKKELLGTPDRYCLPTKLVNRVIQDLHFVHMHMGTDGITRHAQS